MKVDKYEDGRPSWVDVSVPDLTKGREFYASLFGWDAPEGPPEAGGYSVATLGGENVAGIGPVMNPAAPPSWMTYVNVDDADATLAKVGPAGGTVFMEVMDVMDVGRMAVFADPVGAVIGIWQPKSHLGAGVVNEPNSWIWSELMTTDLETSKTFYKTVFGWDANEQGPPGGPVMYTEWQIDGRSIGGMIEKPAEVPAPPHWGVYFGVADINAGIDKIKTLGGSIMMGPTEIDPGTFAVAVDPQGVFFNVMQLKEIPEA